MIAQVTGCGQGWMSQRSCGFPTRARVSQRRREAGAPGVAFPQDDRFLKNRSQGREATRTLSTAFPNSRSRTSPGSATGIRVDARAYTPARDGGLREKACSTAFPGQPARAEPSRLLETSRRGRRSQNRPRNRPHNRRALEPASPRSERRSRPMPYGPAAECSARG